MLRIVATITSLAQHLVRLVSDPEWYRPSCCPHCGGRRLWCHGCYTRKADRRPLGGPSGNPVPIPRFCCATCRRTCSRVPACIAPRRWYDWTVQQVVLRVQGEQGSLHAAARAGQVDRRTARRWSAWLAARGEVFAFHLRSRFPDWGRAGDTSAFWRTSLAERSLPTLMAWLDRELTVP